jgi:hypothetical protein
MGVVVNMAVVADMDVVVGDIYVMLRVEVLGIIEAHVVVRLIMEGVIRILELAAKELRARL